jgi:hypothetical protein
MKKQAIIKYFILLLFSFTKECPGNNLTEVVICESQNDFNIDSIPGEISFGVIEVNPIQPLFGEIPFSFELFRPKEKSVQFQVEFIFPFPEESLPGKFFVESGPNGNASSEGLISYRTSPYKNYGLSFKLEFRK